MAFLRGITEGVRARWSAVPAGARFLVSGLVVVALVVTPLVVTPLVVTPPVVTPPVAGPAVGIARPGGGVSAAKPGVPPEPRTATQKTEPPATGPGTPPATDRGAPPASHPGAGSGVDFDARPGGSLGSAADAERFLRLQDEWESRLNAKAGKALGAALRKHVVVAVNLELDPRAECRTVVNVPPAGWSGAGSATRTAADSGAIAADPNLAPAAPGLESSFDPRLESRLDPRLDPRLASRLESRFESRLRKVPPPRSGSRSRLAKSTDLDPRVYGKQTEVRLAPAIRRITASVLIDAGAFAATVDAEEMRRDIEEIVRHAIGFDEDRGDRMHVSVVVPVGAGAAATGSTGPEVDGSGWWDYGWLALGLVAAIAALVFERRRRAAAAPKIAEPEAEPQPTPDQRAARAREEIEAAIAADPSAASRVLGAWAMEGRT